MWRPLPIALILAVLGIGLAGAIVSLSADPPTTSPQVSVSIPDGFQRPSAQSAPLTVVLTEQTKVHATILSIIQALNNGGEGLETFYLQDSSEVFFGPPAAGPELTRTIQTENGPVDVVQTGVVSGDQVVTSLRTCLAAFAQAGVVVSVQPNNDLRIRVLGDLAYASLTGANVTEATGQVTPFRWSLVLENVTWPDGQKRWMVVHDHLSFS